MKTKRRMLSFLLCFVMVFSYCGYIPMAEELGNTEKDISVEQCGTADTEQDEAAYDELTEETASVSTGASVIAYVVVENDYVVPGDEQYVLIGLDDSAVCGAKLNYVGSNGASYSVSADTIDSEYALFFIDTGALSQDVYKLYSVDLIYADRTEVVIFEEIGVEALFGVNTEISAEPYGWLVDDSADTALAEQDEVEGIIVKDAAAGEAVTADDISKAVEESGVEIDLTNDVSEDGIVKHGAEFVVVLDPGHGAGDSGATYSHGGVTYAERELNLKIATACKEELERLGIKVYMTRYDNNSLPGLTERAKIAASYDADILVSIHNNAQPKGTARGSEVWIPNTSSFNYFAHEVGEDLGNRIINNLAALGLNKRGVFTRNATPTSEYPEGERYDTGDISDYYTVINASRRRNIAAMIIEHAYVSNAADAAEFLGSDEALRKLGVSDAQAIYAYYQSLPKDYPNDCATITYGDYGGGAYTLVASGVPDAYNVSFKITAVKSGETKEVGAIKGGDNWFADFNVSDFGVTGEYKIEAYVNKVNKKSYRAGYTSLTVAGGSTSPVENPADVIAFNADGDSSIILIAANVPDRNLYSRLWFNVTAPDGKRIKYDSMEVEGGWLALIAVSDFKQSGTYTVSAVTDKKNGSYVGESTFYIAEPTAASIGAENINYNKGTFDIVVRGVQSNTGVASLKIPAFTKGDLSDLYWYTAEKQSDGTYVAHASIKNHNNNYGVYAMQAYITAGNGIEVVPVSNCCDIAKPTPAVWAYDLGDNNTYIMGTDNLPYGGDIVSAKFAVWNEGISDLRWYDATVDADGRWLAFLNISNDYKKAGTYVGDAYVTYRDGRTEEVGLTFFFVDEPKAKSMYVANANNTAGTFDIIIDGVSCKSGIRSVRVPVFSQPDLGDIYWYDAIKQSDGTYKVSVDIRNHKNHYAVYAMQAYVTSGSGVEKIPVSNVYFFSQPSDQLYPIEGTSCVSVDQMVKYYKKRAVYPAFYQDSDAPTIEDFCRIYYEECQAEGIRAEVAFCQCMKETGFLKFGGDVKIEQYNFCGLGAVGGGAEGQSFASVRLGARAHIQHLKAYANREPLKNACEDPRFSLVTRGTAPYVEWLGINENPYGKGWAVALRYGYSLKNDYMSKLMGN